MHCTPQVHSSYAIVGARLPLQSHTCILDTTFQLSYNYLINVSLAGSLLVTVFASTCVEFVLMYKTIYISTSHSYLFLFVHFHSYATILPHPPHLTPTMQWDAAVHGTDSAISTYYRESHGIIIVYDVTDQASTYVYYIITETQEVDALLSSLPYFVSAKSNTSTYN